MNQRINLDSDTQEYLKTLLQQKVNFDQCQEIISKHLDSNQKEKFNTEINTAWDWINKIYNEYKPKG